MESGESRSHYVYYTDRRVERGLPPPALALQRCFGFKPLFSPPLKSNTDKFSSHPTPLDGEGERTRPRRKEGRKESQREKLAR